MYGNSSLTSIPLRLLSDEDLSSMYLTAKKEHRARGLQDHEELELLLESFSKQVEEIVSEVEAITVSCYRGGVTERRHR
jgi:magnesium transporter